MAAPLNINANLNLNPASINASAKQVQQALGRITGQASEFQKSLDASTARVFAFGATTAVINGVTQSFKALISTTITVQSKLVEINSILGAGAQEFNKYRNSIFQVAKVTGQSFETVAEGAAELARQGLSATESAKRLQASLILTRISGLGAEQSVKALTAAMNGFTSAGLSAEQVVNKIVAVDTAFAVSAQDLAEGFSRAGSTAEDAGVSFDELLGLITAVEQRTARGGAVIGNAFKSIFTRLSRGTTIEDLKSLGVEINATQTGVQKLQALSKALENISDPTVASQIKELAGGVFQINVVSAALKDIGSDASVFGQATAKSFNATNEATSKNIALNEQLSAQINSLVVSVTSLGAKLGGITFGPLLKNLVGLATKFSEMLDGAFDPEKGNKFIQSLFKIIGGFLSGPGLAIFTVAFAKIFGTVLKFAKDGFKTVMQMGSATEKIKNIEGGIVGLLQKDATLRQTLASTTATQAQKEQAVITAIQKENQLLAQQEQLVRNIARQAAARGVTGFSGAGGFAGKKGKRFAAGGAGEMEPNLMTAMMNEARDAPRGATPFVTNFRGQPAVMNTSEMQVRINGREEILREDQIPRFNKGSKLNKEQRAGMGHRQGALNRDGRFIMLHGARTGYKLNKFYMGVNAKDPSKAGKPTLGPTENNKTLINVPTYGIPKDKKGIGDINTIIKKLGDTSLDEAIRIAKDLSKEKMPDGNRATIKKEIASQINNGTHKAFAGNIQELALGSLLTGSQFDDYVAQGTGSTFDLNLEGQTRLKGLYNVRRHVAKTGEVKASGSNSLAGDTARKIFRVSKMNEAIHSTKGGNKAINPKKFKGVTIPLKRGGTQTIKTMKGLTSAIYGKGTQHAGKKITQDQLDGLASGRIAPKTKSKGSLPNLKIKRYNEGSMGMDIDSLMFLAMGMGVAGSGGAGKGKDPIKKIKADNQKIVKTLAKKQRAAQAQQNFNNSRTGKFINKTGTNISNVGSRIGSGIANSRVAQGVGRIGSGISNFGARGGNLARSGLGNVRQFGANLMHPARAMGSNIANSRFGQNRLVRGAVNATRSTLTNRTPSLRGGMGLSMAGQGVRMLSPKLEEAGAETAAAFTDATSTITTFAATGAMIGGPMGAAAGAAVGFGKALLDSKAMTEEANKIEAKNAKLSADEKRSLEVKRNRTFIMSGIMKGDDNAKDTLAGRGRRIGDKEIQKRLSTLARETGIKSLDVSRELEQVTKALSNSKISVTDRIRLEEEFQKLTRKAAFTMKNAAKIQANVNQIKKNEIALDKERKNLIAERVGKDIMKEREKSFIGGELMTGKEGPFASLLKRDYSISSMTGETAQAQNLLRQLTTQVAGAPGDEALAEQLKKASEDFKARVKEGAIFMQQKQNEVTKELRAAAKDRLNLISERDKARSDVNVSDMTKAGTGEIFDLGIVGRFQEFLTNIRNSDISGDEKSVRIAELVAEVSEATSGLNEGRQKLIKDITIGTMTATERSAAAGKRAIGGEQVDASGLSLKERFMSAGVDEGAYEKALTANEEQMRALATQQEAIKTQMQNYAAAFDVEGLTKVINNTESILANAATDLAGYASASEKIANLSVTVLDMAENARVAIETQNAVIKGLADDNANRKKEINSLAGNERPLLGPGY